jgi:DNA-binding MarR family transcriptional regulator
MKRVQRLILKTIYPLQRQPIPMRDLARRSCYSRRTLQYQINVLERAGFLRVDRSEQPHAYEISERGLVELHKP